eukprot:403374329
MIPMKNTTTSRSPFGMCKNMCAKAIDQDELRNEVSSTPFVEKYHIADNNRILRPWLYGIEQTTPGEYLQLNNQIEQKPSFKMLSTPQPIKKDYVQKQENFQNIDKEIRDTDFRNNPKTPDDKQQRPMRPEPQQNLRRFLNFQNEPQHQLTHSEKKAHLDQIHESSQPKIVSPEALDVPKDEIELMKDKQHYMKLLHKQQHLVFNVENQQIPELQETDIVKDPYQLADISPSKTQSQQKHKFNDPNFGLSSQKKSQLQQQDYSNQQNPEDFTHLYPHNQRVSEKNRVSRLNIDFPQQQLQANIRPSIPSHRQSQYSGRHQGYNKYHIPQSDRLKGWGKQNEFWNQNRSLSGKKHNFRENQEQTGLRQTKDHVGNLLKDQFRDYPDSTRSEYMETEYSRQMKQNQDSASKKRQSLQKDFQKLNINPEDQYYASSNKNLNQKSGSKREQPFQQEKPKIQSQNSKAQDRENFDLHSHKVKDDVERYEIEQYLNQGKGNFLDDVSQKHHYENKTLSRPQVELDHPHHVLDPQLEAIKDKGNFKFQVVDVEKEKDDLKCENCINHSMIIQHQRERAQRQRVQERENEKLKREFNSSILNIGHNYEPKVDKEKFLRDLQVQIKEGKMKKQFDKQNEQMQDQTDLFVENFYHNQYPMYKNEYPMGNLQPCSGCHHIYPTRKLQKYD